MATVIERQNSQNIITPRSVIIVNPTLTVILAPIDVVPGTSFLTGEFINDDLSQIANLQIEESWSSSGPWTVALYNELQNIAAGEARRFYLSLIARGPFLRITGMASGAGLSGRRSFAMTAVEFRRGQG